MSEKKCDGGECPACFCNASRGDEEEQVFQLTRGVSRIGAGIHLRARGERRQYDVGKPAKGDSQQKLNAKFHMLCACQRIED